VLPKRTTSALTRNQKSSEGDSEPEPGAPEADEDISGNGIAAFTSEDGA